MTAGVSETLDERGRLCPQPVIALGRAARRLPVGSVIVLLADDEAARTDVPAWCRMRGADLMEFRESEQGQQYRIRLNG